MAQNHPSFETCLKKGELGESFVRKLLEDKGWVVYFPFTKNRAHYFDMLATSGNERAIALDVKTKARLNCFAATGIDVRHYHGYMRFVESTKVPFWIVFVDEMTGQIHAAELSKLINSKLISGGRIIVWPISQMKLIGELSTDDMNKLSELSQRGYQYNPMEESLCRALQN